MMAHIDNGVWTTVMAGGDGLAAPVECHGWLRLSSTQGGLR